MFLPEGSFLNTDYPAAAFRPSAFGEVNAFASPACAKTPDTTGLERTIRTAVRARAISTALGTSERDAAYAVLPTTTMAPLRTKPATSPHGSLRPIERRQTKDRSGVRVSLTPQASDPTKTLI
jgi:hypothetical protein